MRTMLAAFGVLALCAGCAHVSSSSSVWPSSASEDACVRNDGVWLARLGVCEMAGKGG